MELGGRGAVITKIRWFYEHYNGIILHYTTHYNLFLACFPVDFLYIPVQKFIFLILTHDSKKAVGIV